MSKKIDSLMKAITKIVKDYANSTDCKDPNENAENMQKEVEEFLKDCGIDDLEVEVFGMSMEDAKNFSERATRIKEARKKEEKEGIVYYLTDTGDRVHIGSIIMEHSRKGKKQKSRKITITEDNIDMLIANGTISKKKKGEHQIPMGILHYLNKIGDKLHFKVHNVVEFFAYMDMNYPIASISILLREIALTMDHYYKDNIKKCNNIFYISFVDGEIHKIPVSKVRNFRAIAAFRTREDAENAMKIAEKIFEELFKSDEEYNKEHFPYRCGNSCE